jgi:hypothetical protein
MHHRARLHSNLARTALRARADDGSVVTLGRYGIRVVSSRSFTFPWRIGGAKEMDDAAANA